jgi:predicted PurR-regulated permease PerM
MRNTRIQLYFFLTVFVFFTYLTLTVFTPLLGVLVLSGVFAFLLHPVYKRTLPLLGNHRSITAGLVIVLVSAFLLLCLVPLAIQIFLEAQQLYLAFSGNSGILNTIKSFEEPLQKIDPSFTFNIQGNTERIFNLLINNAADFAANILDFLFKLMLGLVASFFFLRDGEKMIESIIKISPLDRKYDNEVIVTVGKMINSIVKGTLLIGLIQGLVTGIGLFIFGVPNPAFWGTVAAITALIPGVGTAIVFIPSIIYVYYTAGIAPAIGLLIWGALAVGLIDNMLLPYLYSRGSKLHPIFVGFSVLGGLAVFGPSGFIFGPIILSFFYALLHIYDIIILDVKREDQQA